MIARASLALLITLTACSSGDDTNAGTPIDAAVAIDAPTNTNAVQPVTPCPANVALTVTSRASEYVFAPDATTHTIAVGDVVHFMLASIHNAVPKNGVPSDPGLNVGFGGDACVKFTKAGSFTFACSAHGFSGTITVQ
ncbi:MAG TPA: hypothetical protein VGC42_32630 [Kofleriaceae bacterium]